MMNDAVRRRTVLVLDDEAAVCRSIAKILTRRGYRVDAARSSGDAIARLADGEHVDLVLVDLMMPDLPGVDFIRLAAERWPRLPVVVITGYATLASAIETTRLGAVDYLEKPFTPPELETIVAAAMARGTWKTASAGSCRAPIERSDGPVLIDVDLPFSEREVAAVTGDAYVRALGRGGHPVVGRWPDVSHTRPRVLAVDDEPVVVQAIRKSLGRNGYRVDEAFSGRAALARVATQPYDLLLLDLRMPDIHGLDLLPKIRECQPRLPIVIVTGYASIDSAVEAIQKGAADYVPKPFTPEELRQTAARVLTLHRAA